MTGSLAGLVHAARRLTPRRGQGGDQLARLCSAGPAISVCPRGIASRPRTPVRVPSLPVRWLHLRNMSALVTGWTAGPFTGIRPTDLARGADSGSRMDTTFAMVGSMPTRDRPPSPTRLAARAPVTGPLPDRSIAI